MTESTTCSDRIKIQLGANLVNNRLEKYFFYVMLSITLLSEILTEKASSQIQKWFKTDDNSHQILIFIAELLQKISLLAQLSEFGFGFYLIITFLIFAFLIGMHLQIGTFFSSKRGIKSFSKKWYFSFIGINFTKRFEFFSLLFILFWGKLLAIRESRVQELILVDTTSISFGADLTNQKLDGFIKVEKLKKHSLLSEKIEFFTFQYFILAAICVLSGVLLILYAVWESRLAESLPLEHFPNNRSFSIIIPRFHKFFSIFLIWIAVWSWPEANPIVLYLFLLLSSVMMLVYSWTMAGKYSEQRTQEITISVKKKFI